MQPELTAGASAPLPVGQAGSHRGLDLYIYREREKKKKTETETGRQTDRQRCSCIGAPGF